MTGLLLLNLGTPDAPTTPAVRRYLREFLLDPRVVDLNPVARRLLVYLVILPFRPAKSAAAYRKVWTTRGSPLLANSVDFTEKLRARLGAGYAVELGMRYGNPSTAGAVGRLVRSGAERLVVLPLFPQYSSAATASATQEALRAVTSLPVVPDVRALQAFHDDPGFLDAFAAVGRAELSAHPADHVLFSFHGLPERQIRACDPTGRHCLATSDCCDALGQSNRDCYRAQCFATARGLAARLDRADGTWSVSFQSRLGRTPWIKPYTDLELPRLAAEGKRRLAVFCPAFVADCLETLEEIGIRAREQFAALGGELHLVPSLNATDAWVEACARIVERA